MSSRRDIMVPRKKKDGGTYWVKIGTAWDNDGKTQLVFDALPIPDADGRCVANLFEPREQGDNPRGRSAAADRDTARSRSRDDDVDADSIPF